MSKKTKAAVGEPLLVALVAGAAIGQAGTPETPAQARPVTTTITQTVTADPALDEHKAAQANLRELRKKGDRGPRRCVVRDAPGAAGQVRAARAEARARDDG